MKQKNVSVKISGLKASCKGVFNIETHTLTVLAGSVVRKDWSPNFKYWQKRNSQIEKYCKKVDDSLILNQDVEFVSPTAAAKFCMGYEVNGMVYWKTLDNIKLKDL